MSWPGISGPGVVVWPLRSGSSGNCLLVGSGGATLLVDAGFRSQRDFRLALEGAGVAPSSVSGILVSHTHADHINYTTYRVAEANGIPLYVHTRNWERACKLYYLNRRAGNPPWRGRHHLFRFGEPFEVGGAFLVEAAEVPHDGGACSCFLVTCSGSGYSIAVATDLGTWGRKLVRFISRADYLVVESNWDPELIEASTRDPRDVARVKGDRGHLSNDDAAALICEVAGLRGAPPSGVMLAHLSADHNSITTALARVRRVLSTAGLGHVPLTAAPRGRMGEPVVLVT
jgi:phosphoribosyl 1,2-cyclic phosphodiesterase